MELLGLLLIIPAPNERASATYSRSRLSSSDSSMRSNQPTVGGAFLVRRNLDQSQAAAKRTARITITLMAVLCLCALSIVESITIVTYPG